MGALDRFHVEVECASGGVAADGGIAGIGEGAGLAVAEACDIVFVAAEVLEFGCSVAVLALRIVGAEGERVDTDLSLKEQNCWLIICQTISSDAMVTLRVVVGLS